MSYKEEIKAFLEERGIDMFGVASIDSLKNEPDGQRPEQILPGAKSVIVFGRRILDGSMQALEEGIAEHNEVKVNTYGAFGKELTPNFALSFDAFYLTQYLERKYDVICVPLTTDLMQNKPAMDIRHLAVAAGLGQLAWNGHVVTEKYGPRMAFIGVITTMELEADAPWSGKKLCDPAVCHICTEVCPVAALPAAESGKCETCTIGGLDYSTAAVEENACMVAAYGLRKEFGGLKDYVSTIHPNDEEMDAAFRAISPNDSQHISHFPNWKCEKCFVFCPLGKKEKGEA